MNDLRYAIRQLVRNPGFAAAAVLTLALGIGATTAVFSVLNAVLLRPLPYEDPDRLVGVYSVTERGWALVSPPDFVDWRAQSRSFEAWAALDRTSFAIHGDGPAERVPGARATAGFFRALGAEPALGRGLTLEDEERGRHRVAVLSHSLWTRRFGREPGVLGRSLHVDGETFTIVGVMPPRFDFQEDAELWVPLAFTSEQLTEQRGSHFLDVVARLRPGASLEEANAEMREIARRLQEQHPRTNADRSATVLSLRDWWLGDVRPALLALFGAVAFLLLIACVNVANLMLARAVTREQELAVRAALGAGRGRLARALLTESLVLGLLGGALGVGLAVWSVGLLRALRPDLPRIDQAAVDASVLAFALAVSLVTGILFGVLPALQASGRLGYTERLKLGARGLVGSRKGRRTRSGLVVAEIALALVLAVGAGLLLKSFARLMSVPPGFDAEDVLTFTIVFPESRYGDADRVETFVADLLGEVRSLPGVESAAGVFGLPLSGFQYGTSVLSLDGRAPASPQDARSVQVRAVTPDYFRVLRIPLRRGRVIEETDRHGAPTVAIVNESAARLLWSGRDPLGSEIRLSTGFGLGRGRAGGTVVGVVEDVRHYGLDHEPVPEVYLAHRQFPVDYVSVVVRSASDPLALAGPIRTRLASLDPGVPMFRVRTMREWMDQSVALPRLYATLLALFGFVALALAAVGIYGVIAYGVAQRTGEIGIRIALGARRDAVLRGVMARGLVLALAGTAIGLAGAWGATRTIAGLLYDVRPTDTVTLASVSLLLIAVALLACYVPARRAMNVDPMTALRHE